MPKGLVENCIEVRQEPAAALHLAIQLTRWKLIRDGKLTARRDEVLPLEVRKVALYAPDAPDWHKAVTKVWLNSKEGQTWLASSKSAS